MRIYSHIKKSSFYKNTLSSLYPVRSNCIVSTGVPHPVVWHYLLSEVISLAYTFQVPFFNRWFGWKAAIVTPQPIILTNACTAPNLESKDGVLRLAIQSTNGRWVGQWHMMMIRLLSPHDLYGNYLQTVTYCFDLMCFTTYFQTSHSGFLHRLQTENMWMCRSILFDMINTGLNHSNFIGKHGNSIIYAQI